MADYDNDEVVVIEKHGSVSGFLWGALIGAAAMLLYAPGSGVETRRELARSMRRLRQTANATLHEVQDSMNDAVREARGTLESQMEATRSALEASREAARAARSDIENRWEQGRQGVRSAYRPGSASAGGESTKE